MNISETTHKFLKNIGTALVGFGLGILINIPACNPQVSKVEYIPVHDTVTVDKEHIIEHTVVRYVNTVDTFYTRIDSNKVDTVFIKDIPIEYKEYKDTIKNDSTSAELMIQYHGFASDIDSVNIIYNYFNKQETIIEKPKKIGLDLFIGPYIGYGCGVNPQTSQFMHGPNIGIAVGIGFGYRIK